MRPDSLIPHLPLARFTVDRLPNIINSEENNTETFPFTLKSLSSNILYKHQPIHRNLHLASCFQLGGRHEKVTTPVVSAGKVN
jgi:hypothetical protein